MKTLVKADRSSEPELMGSQGSVNEGSQSSCQTITLEDIADFFQHCLEKVSLQRLSVLLHTPLSHFQVT